jgi:protein subunit release factor B
MSKKLLFSVTRKDFKIEYFSGTGPGGQYRNKHQNCVRLTHPESGALVTGQSSRERLANTREAFKNLIKNPKFKLWHARMVMEKISGKSLDDIVDEMMEPKNLKIEYIDR